MRRLHESVRKRSRKTRLRKCLKTNRMLSAWMTLVPTDLKNRGKTALRSAFSLADSDQLPCYLETFRERDLPFYEEHGFRIFGVGRVPSGGPVFWSMMRAAR